jgi:5-methylcytosine-specific restriction endonuclease McrA
MSQNRRLYDTVQWRKVAKRFLFAHPLCLFCNRMGRISPATVVDHIVPHKGDLALFWDESNLQPLCKKCHDNTKKIQEIHGYSPAAGIDGHPIDRNHPWNK